MSEKTSIPLIEDPVENSSKVIPRLTWKKINYKPPKLQDLKNVYCQGPKNMCGDGFYKCQKNNKKEEVLTLDWTEFINMGALTSFQTNM